MIEFLKSLWAVVLAVSQAIMAGLTRPSITIVVINSPGAVITHDVSERPR